MSTTESTVVFESAARALVEATGTQPFLFELAPAQGRKALEDLQSGTIARPDVEIEDRLVLGGPSGEVSVRILRPAGRGGLLPVILFIHGAGWVFGSKHTHDRLIRELCAGTGAGHAPQTLRSPRRSRS
jgi:acetyl esterase/lipase